MKIAIILLGFVLHATPSDFPVDAYAKISTNSCKISSNVPLRGRVQAGDAISVKIKWLASAPGGLIGVPRDSLGNDYIPDERYGIGGKVCDLHNCELRLVSYQPSIASGGDVLLLPLFCPAITTYNIWAEADNPCPSLTGACN